MVRAFTKYLPAAVAALALASMAGASFADTVATGSQKGKGTDIRWVRSSGKATGGHLYTGGSTATAATNVPYNFNFNFDPLDTLLGSISNVVLKIDATAANGHAATGVGTNQQQTGLNGYLTLDYTGATPLQGCIKAPCTTLLRADFTDGWLVGGGSAGAKTSTISFTAFNDPTVPGSSVAFSSDFFDASRFIDQNFNFSFSSAGVITHQSGKALSNFTSSSSGVFSGKAIPEPATWALMILGFGGAGAVLRRRRQVALAA